MKDQDSSSSTVKNKDGKDVERATRTTSDTEPESRDEADKLVKKDGNDKKSARKIQADANSRNWPASQFK